MMRLLPFAYLALSALALRRARPQASTKTTWSTLANQDNGPCAENPKKGLPVSYPLLCSGPAYNLTFSATARGWAWTRLRLSIDGASQGKSKRYPPWSAKRTWSVTFPELSDGLHYITYAGSKLDLKEVQLQGDGGTCSFSEAPGFAAHAEGPTYGGFDTFNRFFGPDRDFPLFKKHQLYFASETVGKAAGIDATVVADGVYQWLWEYSQNPNPGDWGSRGPTKGWAESDMVPHMNASLSNMPRHRGQSMEVWEPCNTLANLAFHEAAVWASCKGYHMTPAEYASVVAGFNGVGAGSAFLHASMSETGNLGDVFFMDWMQLQIYQFGARKIVADASHSLTQEEQDAIIYLGDEKLLATDVAVNMTRLFAEKYDSENWYAVTKGIHRRLPKFEKSIAATIGFTLYGLEGKLPIPGLEEFLNAFVGALLDLFGFKDREWFLDFYVPTVKKAFKATHICNDAVMGLLGGSLAFAVTFIEALVFQEQRLPVPPVVRDAIYWLNRLGLSYELYNSLSPTWEFYNGFDCTKRSDHATWHEMSAYGLLHALNVMELFATRTGPNCS